ncbi:hypothetical protein ACFQ1S_07540 [Kibdelosporangium lantanae]|uniref:Transcriptional regulator SbtR-like C-terminal domain-containing protein n=1 Tax=Kibdelosporangium lantanae TaxID=1497396 RepID=A0ABW3M760_9PSEU
MSGSRLVALGHHQPSRVLANTDLERMVDTSDEWIRRRTGIATRHIADSESVTDMATSAAAKALATADPWEGFVSYLVGLYELQAHDRALNDAISQRIPLSAEVLAACHQGLEHVTRVIDRAKASGQLRADYSPTDLPPLSAAMSRVITEFPNDWRRFLAHYVDGLRATEHTGRPSSGHNLSLTGRTAEPRPE